MSLNRYKWYQSQTPDDALVRTLGPEGERIVRSHIDWREEWVPTRTLVPKRGGLWDPTSVGNENKTFFIRVWKPLPSIRILKTLRGSPKGKAQRGQYLLAVGLGYYKWYQNQTLSGVPTRTLSHKGGWIVRSHINWREERVPARTLGPEGGWILRTHISWGGEWSILYKGMETSP